MQNTYNHLEWLRLTEFYEISNDVREREYTIEALANTRQAFLLDRYSLEL